MTLKVCHVISGDLWAGAEVMAFHLLLGLSKRPEVDLLVILLNRGVLADRLQKAGVRICVLDEHRFAFPEIVRLAAMAMRKWAPDVLHSHRYKENFLSYLASLALKTRPALVSTQHGMPESYGRHTGMLRRLKIYANSRLLASKFRVTVAVSADMEKSLASDQGFPRSRLVVIRNGIAIPEPRGGTTGPRESLVIGAAGRMVPVKDYPLMIESAKRVCARLRNVRFELAGDGPLTAELQALVRQKGLEDRFRFRGFISDVRTFYTELDVFLNTSSSEGIPMSILEAMALGVPPVVPAVGGLKEIITDGEDGYLVRNRDPSVFAERCVALCTDQALRQRMARAARETVTKKFSVERMVSEYVELYVTIAAPRSRPLVDCRSVR